MSIRALRQESGKTQREVSIALDVAERTYVRWEQGEARPDAGNLIRLLDYFRTATGRQELQASEMLDSSDPSSIPQKASA